ncbi:hypothetical protein HRbin36_02093 [bacterium HR36]|nr:hypothetical protein HRbin36_02093 [bacterium HR36]
MWMQEGVVAMAGLDLGKTDAYNGKPFVGRRQFGVEWRLANGA